MRHTVYLRPLFRRSFPRHALRRLAERVGYGERRRKCPPDRFFLTLVLGFACEATRTLASLQRFFCTVTRQTITSAAFQKRFTPAAVEYLRAAALDLLARQRAISGAALPRRLSRFSEVLAIDSSLVNLHRRLCRHFRGFRARGTESMAKVHLIHNLRGNAIERFTINSGRVPDLSPLRRGRLTPAALYLFDLAYYSHDFFARIGDRKAFFVCKLKRHVNPLVTCSREGAAALAPGGERLKALELNGEVLDLDARFGRTRDARTWRIVGIRDPQSGQWLRYITNLPPDLSPQELSQLYRLRWEVELLFRELKSAYRLSEVPSRKPNTARCLMLAALLSVLVARVLRDVTARRHGLSPAQISPRRMAAIIGHNAVDLARAWEAERERLLSRALALIADTAAVTARAAPARGGAALLRP